MKKILAVIMAAVVSVSMIGCSSESSSSAEGKADYSIGICQLAPHPALDAATEGFMEKLSELMENDGKSVSFDVKNANGEAPTCSTIVNGFVSSKADLILANATAPLQSAAAGTADIPILGTSVSHYGTALDEEDMGESTGRNISGTSDLAPLDKQAEMVREWFPDAKNIGLVYCSSEANSVYQINVIKPMLEEMGYICTEYSFADSNDISTVVTNAVQKSEVIYVPTDNAVADNSGIIANISIPAGVPVIAGEEGICSGCGVATLSISYRELGEATAQMAYDILVKGKDISSMPIQFAPDAVKKYNKSICDQLGLTPPSGYEAIAE